MAAALGWEKGQVEIQVGLVRERFFTPRLRFKTLDELNAWLLDKCIAYAKTHKHPEFTDKTVWEVFEAERPKLVAYVGRSTASTPCRRQSPRPAGSASTTTSTRWRPVRSGALSRSMPMPTAS